MLHYLLDTHIVICVIKRRPLQALKYFNQHAGRMAISAITLAELMHGAKKSSKPLSNLAVVEDFCSRLEECRMAPRPPSITARYAQPSNKAGRRLA